MNRHPLQNGFTLLEILVVVFIIGILASLIVPNIIGRKDQAMIIAVKNDVRTLVGALKLYRLDNSVYPDTEQGLKALTQKPESGRAPQNWKSGGYIDRLPKDPWQLDYQYLNPGVHGEIDVFSLGADNQPGGEGNDADIGNWEATSP